MGAVDASWRRCPISKEDLDQVTQCEFFRRCVLELSQHRSADLELMQSSRAEFARGIQRITVDYASAECYARPKSAKSPIWSSLIHIYWSTLRFSCPHFHFIYHILSHCCATEAGTECTFSSEKMIHYAIRNSLDPQLIRAIMTIRWNFEALQQFGGLSVPEEDSSDHDLEFLMYENE